MTTSLALLFYFSIYFSFIVWQRVWEWSVTLSGMWGAISWGVQTFPPTIFCRSTKNNWSCLDQHGWQNWRGKTKSDTVWGKSFGRALMQTRLVSSFHTAVNNRWAEHLSQTYNLEKVEQKQHESRDGRVLRLTWKQYPDVCLCDPSFWEI